MVNQATHTTQLKITVNTRRMLNGAQFRQAGKAVEHLYYLELFATNPAYSDNRAWFVSWERTGLDLAVRAQPPVGKPADILYLTTQGSEAHRIEFRVSSGDGVALGKLVALFQRLDKIRPSLSADFTKDDRVRVLTTDSDLAGALFGPVQQALGKDTPLADRFRHLATEALLALSDSDVTSIESS
jgi:hypothetical protein